MDYKQINEILSNISNPNSNNSLIFVEKQNKHMGVSDNSYYSDGVQGESDQYVKIFKLKSDNEIYVAFEYETDSYGDNERVTSIQFVKPANKTVINYEPIK